MRKITKIAYLVIVCMTISLSNINASINSETTTHQTPQNKGLTLKISNEIIQVTTPMNPLMTPITVRVLSNTGTVLFEKTTVGSSMVVGDSNRVHSDSIEHLRIEVSQGGQVILNQKL